MEPSYALACVVLIIILILFKYNLRVLHNRTKPVSGDQSKLSDADKKKNTEHWDKNFSDEDGYSNIGIVVLALAGLYLHNSSSKVSGGGMFGGMFSGGGIFGGGEESDAPASSGSKPVEDNDGVNEYIQ